MSQDPKKDKQVQNLNVNPSQFISINVGGQGAAAPGDTLRVPKNDMND